jgi:hypothetical protein
LFDCGIGIYRVTNPVGSFRHKNVPTTLRLPAFFKSEIESEKEIRMVAKCGLNLSVGVIRKKNEDKPYANTSRIDGL